MLIITCLWQKLPTFLMDKEIDGHSSREQYNEFMHDLGFSWHSELSIENSLCFEDKKICELVKPLKVCDVFKKKW